MQCRGIWGCCLTGVLVFYLCEVVLSKKHRRGETYGDLGDEIIVDTPSRTNKKNEIPRATFNLKDEHKIETRTITKDTFEHHLNPLLYQQLASNYRRPYQIPIRNSISVPSRIPTKTNSVRGYIPPWTRARSIPPWDKKNVIHRPETDRMPSAAVATINRFKRPLAKAARGKVQKPIGKAGAKSATKPLAKSVSKAAIAQYQARKKWYQSHLAAAARASKSNKLRGAAALKARVATPKRRIHVQVTLPRAPVRNAKQLGIHSGFVLMPARSQKRQPGMLSRPSAASRLPRVSSPHERFAEKKKVFVPAASSRHLTSPRKAPLIDVTTPVSDITSYHLNDIGNLIPDISDPKYFEPLQINNRNPLATSTACRIPMKRDGRCAVSSPKTFASNSRLQKTTLPLAAKTNVARTQKTRPASALSISREQQLSRQVKIPPRTSVVQKPPAVTGAKSSQRILYFARNGQSSALQRQQQQQQLLQQQRAQSMRYQLQARKQVRVPTSLTGRAPVAFRQPSLNSRAQTPRKAPTMFEVPKISNKVYNYISQRTNANSALSAEKPVNPLLKYLQYHRTHPSPAQIVQPNQPNRNGLEKKSVVTIRGR